MSYLNMAKSSTNSPVKTQNKRWGTALLATLGLSGLITGCSQADLASNSVANAQTLPSPTSTPVPPTAIPSPTFTPSPTNTPLPTSTPWPTPTLWPTPAAWRPATQPLPTLAPVPIVPASSAAAVTGIHGGSIPVSYSPPDGVDVFGGGLLRWTYYGALAPDEFFDIKIKPVGSNDSVFVDWSKTPEYELRPWSGWTPGLYTWQIGIVKGYLEGETKQFIADTGRDSEPFLIKWQSGGGGGGSNSGGGGGGGGNSSGGS